MSSTVVKPSTTEDKRPYKKTAQEWREVEDLIIKYQKQFDDPTAREEADQAMMALLDRFYPLFKKYLVLIKSAQINFNDNEMKRFVRNFIGDPVLKAALTRKKQTAVTRMPIFQRFSFVKETYGTLPEEEIMMDLKFLFMILAKRYKQMGRNFCAYLYNSYCYEVARHVKKFIDNPANIQYRNIEFEEYMQKSVDEPFSVEDKPFDERLFQTGDGIPDTTWISGLGCSEVFEMLTPLERKVIVKYYLEDHNDKQVAEVLGIRVNIVNSRRRSATEAIARSLNLDRSCIKRNRKSGIGVLKKTQ